jgi:hypothetical protein
MVATAAEPGAGGIVTAAVDAAAGAPSVFTDAAATGLGLLLGGADEVRLGRRVVVWRHWLAAILRNWQLSQAAIYSTHIQHTTISTSWCVT